MYDFVITLTSLISIVISFLDSHLGFALIRWLKVTLKFYFVLKETAFRFFFLADMFFWKILSHYLFIVSATFSLFF